MKIVFYFAGHGSENGSESHLCFENIKYAITTIFEMEGKRKFFIIDACHSGGSALTQNKDKINKYIENSTDAVLRYSCKVKEFAIETSDLKHGIFTSNILDTINNNSNYDSDVFLFFNKIIDVVQKATLEYSDFTQIPVIKNILEVFYLFGIIKKFDIFKAYKKDFSNSIMGSTLKSIAMLQGNPLEHNIYFENQNLLSKFKRFISNNLYNISFEIGYRIYQAKWGVVLLKILFLIDWDGKSYEEIKGIDIKHFAGQLNIDGLNKVKKLNSIFSSGLIKQLRYGILKEKKSFQYMIQYWSKYNKI